MIKLTIKQEKEIEVITYFIPDKMKQDITDEHIKQYLDKSERGIGSMPPFMQEGKKWREVHLEVYKKDWKEGTFWLIEAKEEFPKLVFEKICKSLMGFVPLELRDN